MEKTLIKSNRRNELLDILKGIAIISVVLGHCLQFGAGTENLRNLTYSNNIVFKLIYGFHMPLLMVISGYLFNLTMHKHSFNKIFISRFTTLLLPLFTWALIIVSYNTKLDFGIKNYILTAINNIWFLWALFYCSLTVLLVNKLFKDNIYVYLFGFLLTFFIPDIFGLAKYKFMYPFFVLAYFYGKNEAYFKSWLNKTNQFLKIGIPGLIYIILMQFYNLDSFIYTSGYYILRDNIINQLNIDIYRFLVGISGVLFVILTVEAINKKFNNALFHLLAKVGTLSLGIYIISERIFLWVLPKITASLPSINYLIILLETVIITFVCCLLTLLLKRFRLTRWLFLGGR